MTLVERQPAASRHQPPPGRYAPPARPRPRNTRFTGFTLIELLVVISIIALLIALLLPALKQARGAARGVQCLSNHRQVLIGLINYANDFQGFMPPGYKRYWSGSNPPGPITAHGQTRSDAWIPWHSSYHAGTYFGNRNICSTAWAQQQPSTDAAYCPEKLANAARRHNLDIGIGYNNSPRNFFTRADSAPPGQARKVYDQFHYPSRTFLLMDVESGVNQPNFLWRQFLAGGSVGYPTEDTGGGPNAGVTSYRHNGATSVGFADGHASATLDALADWRSKAISHRAAY